MLKFRPDIDENGNPIMVQCHEDEPGDFVKAKHAEDIIKCHKDFAKDVAKAFYAMGGSHKVWEKLAKHLESAEIVETITERSEDEYAVYYTMEEVMDRIDKKFGLRKDKDCK